MTRTMKLPRMRKSRLALLLVAVAWVPYMAVCCVVSPFEDAAGEKPSCHVLASALPTGAEAHSDSHHSDHDGSHARTDAHAGESGHSGHSSGMPPVQTCCELTGKSNAMAQKSVDFDAQPLLVATTVVVAEVVRDDRSTRVVHVVDVRDHGPPVYLRNASFLI